MSLALILALCAALAWAVLLFGRGFFWLCRENDDAANRLPEPARWPAVVAIVPARDEAETIAATVRGLLAQDYPGPFRLLVVDDRSSDDTGALARGAAAGDPRLTVVQGQGKAPGWTGKLYALEQGRRALEAAGERPDFLLFTDADIHHAPDSLRRLVQRAVAERRVLVSLMAKLRCESPAERALIPAFVFFFAMLYPFGWSNRPRARTAAAAGGCVLLRPDALDAAGGLSAIRAAMIDDCALARLMKTQGPIWLGLTERVRSIRAYDTLDTIRRMVSRTAYAQLGFLPAALAGMLLALTLVFLLPPAFAIGGIFAGFGPAALLGAACWIAMALCYRPMLRRYGRSPLWGLALPGIAALYMGFTFDSAWQDWRGRGGLWKGETRPQQGTPSS